MSRGRRRKQWADCYQIAGGLLLGPDDFYTAGQRARLTEVLLNAMSEPDRYTAKVVRRLARLAIMP
jgi:hypothetical protein